jgi:hypothetical protein
MGILLVYDVTDERSFNSAYILLSAPPSAPLEGKRTAGRSPSMDRKRDAKTLITPSADIRTWHSNVEQHASEGVNKILIGNKCDWSDKKVRPALVSTSSPRFAAATYPTLPTPGFALSCSSRRTRLTSLLVTGHHGAAGSGARRGTRSALP